MRALLAIGLCACSFAPRAAGTGTDAPPLTDAAATPDTPAGATCVGTSTDSLFTVCFPAGGLPTNTVTLAGSYTTLTCAQGQRTLSHGVTACVVAGQTVSITGKLTVTGDVPLVLAATGDATVAMAATIDVSSVGGNAGPDRDATTCNPAGAGAASLLGGGGGAGGSFGTVGGVGGAGATPANGTSGVAVAVTAAVTLRGGCKGSQGGTANITIGQIGGAGGHAGGALYVVAGGAIEIDGNLYASGAGGGGGGAVAGGGGGGTGGLIGLDGATVTVGSGAEIVTNGGAGGGGGGNVGGGGGGDDGTLVSTPGAMGGKGGLAPPNTGGDGGIGTNWANVTGGVGHAPMGNGGAGGGGGGYGIIWVVGTYSNTSGDVSPMQPTLH